jgi:hypothetical protein
MATTYILVLRNSQELKAFIVAMVNFRAAKEQNLQVQNKYNFLVIFSLKFRILIQHFIFYSEVHRKHKSAKVATNLNLDIFQNFIISY